MMNLENKTYNQKIGTEYEYFVRDKIKNEYDQVWHWSDFPEKLMYELGLIRDYDVYSKYRYDIGADVVAIKDGVYYFIQCKNFSSTIYLSELAGFFALLYEFSLNGILYYDGTLSQRVIDFYKKIKIVHLPFNNQIVNIGKNITTIMEPRQYQLDAYNKLEDVSIGMVDIPCGLGKTYISYLLARKHSNIIIFSPLRYLAQQTLEQYKRYLGKSYVPVLVSADGETDSDIIKQHLKSKNIISSTYDSANVVLELISELCDVYVIVDEFHNLSQNNINDPDNSLYKIINNNCVKRIFLSATPLKGFMGLTECCIYKYEWKDAIDNKYICDFNIMIPDKNENFEKFVQLVRSTCDDTIDKKILIKAYFMIKGLIFNGNKKCICYMTTTEKARTMENILKWITGMLNIQAEYWIIDYMTKKTIRTKIIDNFRTTKKLAIIINVHILDEGIDIVECDSVFITQPNNNMINITQRMCRANRITENKKQCTMYLWCSEKKVNGILEHIYENTDGYIKNKITIYSVSNNATNEYKIKKYVENDINNYDTNNNLCDKYRKYIVDNTDDTFLKFYDTSTENKFGIRLDEIIKYLRISDTKNFHARFRKKYVLNDDYVIIRTNKKSMKGIRTSIYFVSYDTFEKICMANRSKKGKEICNYFTCIRKYINFEQKEK